MGEDEEQRKPVVVQTSQITPRKVPFTEEESLQALFLELHGEMTMFVGRAEDAVIAISNYRLHIRFKESVVNIPLLLIESVECRDMVQLLLTCKDCKVIRCRFSTFEQCQEWLKRLACAVRPSPRLEEFFSFIFHACCAEMCSLEKEQRVQHCQPGDHVTLRFVNEVQRMGFDMQKAWRITKINKKYRLCSSYPEQLLVPAWVTDTELESVATFRSWKRFPAVVYRHQSTGAVISRCAQPEVSWWGWRSADDEHLIQSIARACTMDTGSRSTESSNVAQLSAVYFDAHTTHKSVVDARGPRSQKLLILDARSYAAAVANRAKGGGCEYPEYYPNCEVVFMGMANIHSIRRSFHSLRLLCTQMPDPTNWLSALEGTKWLQHLSLLIKAALLVANAVDRDHRPVLVHCSDGWDRTPQIVALSKILLDPYYRTIEGFQVLVEMEWLDFGHKFADRCGHGENWEDINERCPVFMQWLDSVHQLQRQFPCCFEFNEAFLVKLVQHTYSCLFGTFLCNSRREREERRIQERTCSVWSLLRPNNPAFHNVLYSAHSEAVLQPVYHVRSLMLWSAVYLPASFPATPSDDTSTFYPEDPHQSRLPKTRSFESLPSLCESEGSLTVIRRSSVPSLNKWKDQRHPLEFRMGVLPEVLKTQDPGCIFTHVQDAVQRLCQPEEEESEHQGKLPSYGEELNGVNACIGMEPFVSRLAEDAALSVTLTMEQMANILQEASEDDEDGVGEIQKDNYFDCGKNKNVRPQIHEAVTRHYKRSDSLLKQALEDPKVQVYSDGLISKEESAKCQYMNPHPAVSGSGIAACGRGTASRSDPRVTESPCQLALGSDLLPSAVLDKSEDSDSQLLGSVNPLTERKSLLQLPPKTLVSFPNEVDWSHKAEMALEADKLEAPETVPGALTSTPDGPHEPFGLDEDGLALHCDVVQQRLWQMELNHRQQVEVLRRQVQELWGRLDAQRLYRKRCSNGNLGHAALSMLNSEHHSQSDSLLCCGPKLLLQTSCEQEHLPEAEETDHTAAQCHSYEGGFWQSGKKHHCRNCGHMFCTSCCDDLMEPSHICRACYGNGQLSAMSPVDLELQEPITANSH
ncbi:myotubularin-related protein 3-like [Scleropages formosus]|uniref:myotubularin-related protein 3-like n=1 Tax=Scleropages formosus TaxID=113540 RepID=UPI0010FAC120|nr:myotubularin-related protein 3-like [Scleropages formosus]